MKGLLLAVIAAAFLLGSQYGQSGELQLIANGMTYHFDRESSRNESNWGAGLHYQFDSDSKYQPFLSASAFKDSYNNTSHYAGGGYQRRYDLPWLRSRYHVDVGLMAFIMTRKDFRDNKPFIGGLPFASIGNDKVAVNVAYIPNLSFNNSSLMFVQFMFNLGD